MGLMSQLPVILPKFKPSMAKWNGKNVYFTHLKKKNLLDWGDLFFPNFEFTVKFTPNTRDYESRKNIHSWVMLKEFQKRIRVFGKVLFRVSGKIFFRIF